MTGPTSPPPAPPSPAPPPAAAPGGRPLPPAPLAAYLYAIRVSVPPKRAALLAIPLLAAVLFGLLSRIIELDTTAERFNAASGGLFLLVVPLACLVIGDGVLGAEVRAGTFPLTWLSPLPFPVIVLTRWLAGWTVAAAVLVPAMIAASLAGGLPGAALPLSVAALAGSGAYIALFVLVGVTVRRAALWSLAIVLLGERLIGTALDGVAQVSPQWLTRAAYAGFGPDADELRRAGVPDGGGAVLRLAIVAAVCLLLAIWRVRSVDLAADE